MPSLKDLRDAIRGIKDCDSPSYIKERSCTGTDYETVSKGLLVEAIDENWQLIRDAACKIGERRMRMQIKKMRKEADEIEELLNED